VPLEPRPQASELDFILTEAARYLKRAPTRADIRSSWAGLRPLVKPGGDAGSTKSISREHTVRVARSGLVTVTGGKWTTYRAMAEDVLAHCVDSGRLAARGPSRTAGLKLVGAPAEGSRPVAPCPSASRRACTPTAPRRPCWPACPAPGANWPPA
jgi:glycerol-3-phosphate dehydrogenase